VIKYIKILTTGIILNESYQAKFFIVFTLFFRIGMTIFFLSPLYELSQNIKNGLPKITIESSDQFIFPLALFIGFLFIYSITFNHKISAKKFTTTFTIIYSLIIILQIAFATDLTLSYVEYLEKKYSNHYQVCSIASSRTVNRFSFAGNIILAKDGTPCS